MLLGVIKEKPHNVLCTPKREGVFGPSVHVSVDTRSKPIFFKNFLEVL